MDKSISAMSGRSAVIDMLRALVETSGLKVNISLTSAPCSARNLTISASIGLSPVNMAAINGVCILSNKHSRFTSAPFARIMSRKGMLPDFTAMIIASSYSAPALMRLDMISGANFLRLPFISFICARTVYVSALYPASDLLLTSAPSSMSHFTTLGLFATTARKRGL